jgi:hypothetical protein
MQIPTEDSNNLINTGVKKPPQPPAYSAYFDDPATIYAQIDHCNYNKSSNTSLNNGCLKTSNTQNQNLLLTGNSVGSSGCITSSTSTPITAQFSTSYHTQTLPLSSNKQYLREVVTVKTPLSFSEQESCV